eukprot:TRINITY_DN24752_c0_g1_i2.p1 TRINITY_DN24752_c0_g1~~TRINITY_DN24752_c0_g1_i2.p1  ORF type:complete len:254 (+),score=26.40 TRINITY_DN24752_c0_g1_i2:53-814(+)
MQYGISVGLQKQTTFSVQQKKKIHQVCCSCQNDDSCNVLNRRMLIGGGGCIFQQQLFYGRQQSQAAVKFIDYFSPGGFKLSYPKGWLIAYDRSTKALPSTAYGTFFFCGDFKNFETVSVSRMTEGDYGLEGIRDTQGVLEQILGDAINSESTYDFRFLSKSSREETGKRQILYVEGEYLLSTCRGEVIEGKGGAKMCQSKRLERIQPISRHHIITVAIRKDGMVYVLNATAPEKTWEDAKQRILTVQSSFQVA